MVIYGDYILAGEFVWHVKAWPLSEDQDPPASVE